jgi:thiol-disulfide isomerase/thioredoxin
VNGIWEVHVSATHHVRNDLSALDCAPVWLNSEPLTAEALRGRVVLVDIWTYSCVNWLRTLPYVRAWAERYRDRGLVVVGAHCPEFGFEHDLDNVRHAIRELGIDYPVVIDNDFAIWQSLANGAWPAVYLVDRDGRVRYRHFGEGNYQATERAVQQLLGINEETVRVEADGLAEAADWKRLGTGETYVGDGRSVGRVDSPGHLALNQWAVSGNWAVEEESAVLNAPDGSATFRFHARDLNFVLTPPASDVPVRFTVLLDGQLPGLDHGLDVNELGEGTVDEPRMYQLVRQRGGAAARTFEIKFHDPGVRAYVFTFG